MLFIFIAGFLLYTTLIHPYLCVSHMNFKDVFVYTSTYNTR